MVTNQTCIDQEFHKEKMACDLTGTCVYQPNINYYHSKDKNLVKKSQFYVIKKMNFTKVNNLYISEENRLMFQTIGSYQEHGITYENTTSAFVLTDASFEDHFDIFENSNDLN